MAGGGRVHQGDRQQSVAALSAPGSDGESQHIIVLSILGIAPFWCGIHVPGYRGKGSLLDPTKGIGHKNNSN